MFNVDYLEFRRILKQVKPDLPSGQATHVLRHTFVSHFIMNDGSIVALRDILGHAKIEQTMAYAHLAPDFLQNAVVLNPLGGGCQCQQAKTGKGGALSVHMVTTLGSVTNSPSPFRLM